jgi:hypothetical protein
MKKMFQAFYIGGFPGMMAGKSRPGRRLCPELPTRPGTEGREETVTTLCAWLTLPHCGGCGRQFHRHAPAVL